MARTFEEIKQTLLDAKTAESGLNGLNSPSQTAIWRLQIYIQAMSQFIVEQLVALKIIEIETIVKNAPVNSEPWLQAKVLEFQYDAITPQLLTLVNFAPQYNPIDVTKRIITRASVNTAPNNNVLVKVAKGEPPVALSGPELSALQSYLTDGGDGTFVGRGRGLGPAGINIIASSTDADKLMVAATIKYNGQYSGTIQATVISAIEAYLANLPFDGSVSLLSITDAIQSVQGVNDILLSSVGIRPDAGTYTYMVNANTTYITTNATFAGYVVGETNPGFTLADTLIFQAS